MSGHRLQPCRYKPKKIWHRQGAAITALHAYLAVAPRGRVRQYLGAERVVKADALIRSLCGWVVGRTLLNTNVKTSFLIQSFEKVYAVTPAIDGVPLTELIGAFEHHQHFDPAAGYQGIVPQYFNYGPLDRYFLADFLDDNYFSRLGWIYFLGCDCGEVGCWPLQGKIRIDGNSVIWEKFCQPHRPQRDYSAFGPFIFDLDQYREAVLGLCREYAALIAKSK